MSVKIGIIGCGGRIRAVLKQIPEFKRSIEVAALFDPDPRSIKASLEELNPRARIYEDYRALVADANISWVFIGSWNCHHRAHAVAAMEAGKNVFCEKPLATNFEDALAVLEAQRRGGVTFSIGFSMRYSPHYRRIKEVLEAGTIGDIVSMEFNEVLHFDHGGYIHGDWRRLTANAGTHLLEKCCHDIDLAHWMTRSLPVRVASFGGLDFFTPRNRHIADEVGQGPNGRRAFQGWKGLVDLDPFTSDKDIVDNQVAILEFANRTRATFHTNCSSSFPERRAFLCGTRGTLRADVGLARVEVRRHGYDDTPTESYVTPMGPHAGGDVILGLELQATLLEGAPPRASLEDGLASAITCFAIDEAMATGQVVDLRPFWRRAGIGLPVAAAARV